jgi:hypothetical protein
MKLMNIYRLMLAFVLSLTCIACAKSPTDSPEIIVWPHQDTNTLAVAQETTQAFYVMGYTRGAAITGATSVELTVPANWQIWNGSDAPSQNASTSQSQTLNLSWKLRSTKDMEGSKDYSSANSAGNLLLVVRPTAQAAKSTLQLRWLQNQQVIAERQITLNPIPLKWNLDHQPNQKLSVGMWLNDPHFNTQTMAEIYRGLHRAGVDYVIISKAMYLQNKTALDQLGMKVFVNQWWKFNEYVPGVPPAEAAATLKDGSVDSKRWSPTYMAEGGTAFINEVEKVADELKQMKGVYGLMLDYEPGLLGMDADYGEHSRQSFEKYLGRKVLSWPADVLPKGKDEAAWINFRNDQSEAYVKWFKTILQQRAPKVLLAVSTSGATGKPDDPNRVLAATDITQLSHVSDSIHPQLYSWTVKLPAELPRFMDKLQLGKTTIAGAHAPVYPAVGSLAGKRPLSNPTYLRTQILYWWFCGADGFEVWQYFYGVDGNYLAMANEMAHLFQEAGERPQESTTQNAILTAQSSDNFEILHRKSTDGKTAWVGLFNFDSKPIEVPLKTRAGWRLSDTKQTKVTIAPWTACVVKCLLNN